MVIDQAAGLIQPEEVDALMLDAGIIRHRGKIEAIITNAKAFLAMEANGEKFPEFVWAFVENKPKFATLNEIKERGLNTDKFAKC